MANDLEPRLSASGGRLQWYSIKTDDNSGVSSRGIPFDHDDVYLYPYHYLNVANSNERSGYHANAALLLEALNKHTFLPNLTLKINDMLSVSYANMGNYEKAIDSLSALIKVNPKFSRAYRNRAIINHALGRVGSAIEDWTKAIDLEPNNADYFVERSKLYSALGDTQRASMDIEKAKQLRK